MSRTVVAIDDEMIVPDVLREALDPAVTVRVADVDTAEGLIEAGQGADALVVDVATPVSGEVIDALDLAVVARAGVGVDNVDVGAASAADVTVTNVPEYCTEEVSTHAVSLLLACLRRLVRYDASVKCGEWDWTVGRPVHRLTGETVGIAAFGGLARRTAAKLRGFDVDLIAADPYVDAATMAEYDVEKVGQDRLVERADHLLVFTPLTESTYHQYDRAAFERMDEDAVFVNVGRGPVVDEDALLWALEDDEIATAGLDVMEAEPPGDSPLFERDDVLVTPHAAFYSEESLRDLNRTVAANLTAVFAGDRPPGFVDPEAGWV